jgi:hypothetical protein
MNDKKPSFSKSGIWTEWKSGEAERRKNIYLNEPVFGSAWPLIPAIALLIAFLTWLDVTGGPEWLIALRNLF